MYVLIISIFALIKFEKETVSTVVQDPETGVLRKTKKTSALMILSRIFLQAFTLTFLAEWGDRSQLTTIILAAREVTSMCQIIIESSNLQIHLRKMRLFSFQDVYGVVVGGILGHSFCTGLAVLGGRMIAQKISVRTGKQFS